jgi:hypothetical protein
MVSSTTWISGIQRHRKRRRLWYLGKADRCRPGLSRFLSQLFATTYVISDAHVVTLCTGVACPSHGLQMNVLLDMSSSSTTLRQDLRLTTSASSTLCCAFAFNFEATRRTEARSIGEDISYRIPFNIP